MLVSRETGTAQQVTALSPDDNIIATRKQSSLDREIMQRPVSELSDGDAQVLCEKLRFRLLETVSQTGGHLASNLGVVELTVALHRVFDTSQDRLVFDVGHQCYIHKMLTGRDGMMETLRQFGGLAGFPKPSESDHDAFIAGHASNSVSVAMGMAVARSARGEDYSVLALLGDGALTGGLAYEGLSAAGQRKEPLIVILNDNGMSITESVGGAARLIARQRLSSTYFHIKKWYRKIMQATPPGRGFYRFTHGLKTAIKAAILPGSLFEDMGFQYMGPVDGHDLPDLTRLLSQAKQAKGPVLLHVVTKKGKGYQPAERTPGDFHGIAPFNQRDGSPRKAAAGENFSSVFGDTLQELADENPRVCAITAAMQTGTGMADFAKRSPNQFFDVGIAEGHAVSMAAGMAKQGAVPIFAVYSTFFQRSYDMLIHDVAIQRLHVIFCIDRAGLVGDDGETHHGLFDVAFLATIPGLTIYAPASFAELRESLKRAVKQRSGPVAIRYPRGGEGQYSADNSSTSAVRLQEGSDITLVAYGTMINEVLAADEILKKSGISAEIIKLNQLTPLDDTLVRQSVEKTQRILVAEEAVSMGCVGKQLLANLALSGVALKAARLCNCGEGFVTHGSLSQLRRLCSIDGESLAKTAGEVCAHES